MNSVNASSSIEVRSGPWDVAQVERFLRLSVIPVRLASNGKQSPLVQSVWFSYRDGALWCCTQWDSVLARRLARDPHCAFEVAADQPPYAGVRGRGRATLLREPAAALLAELIDRYLGEAESGLRTWLLARADTEVAVRIDDLTVSTWDYSQRMTSASD